MELREHRYGWHVALEAGRVRLIQIDFRLSLLVSDGAGEAWVHIETSGVLKTGARDVLFIPEQTPTLAPILRFFNAEVAAIDINKAGRLIIEFADESLIEVGPDEAYEAWQVGVTGIAGNFVLVCAPGGEIVFFQMPDVPRGIEGANIHSD